MTVLTRAGKLWLLALAAAVLGGCSAQRAYWEAESLRAKGQNQEALAKYEEAWRADPSSVQYRMGYLTHREQILNRWVELADQKRLDGKWDEAELGYRQVVAVQTGHPRGVAGLRLIERQRRMEVWFAEAEQAARRKEWAVAQTKLRTILSEQPDHSAARRLLQTVESEMTPAGPEASLAAAYRIPITLEFREAPLRAVFDVLARTAELNFVFDKDLRLDQRATIFLRNSTLEAALGLLLSTHQLEHRVLNANTVLIYAATPAKQKEHQQLRVKSYYLAHAEAKTVANTLRSLAKAREVVVDDKLNLVMVRENADVLRMVDRLVALHDVPDGEVMLEVEVLEIKRTKLMDLGVRWPDQLTLSPLPTSSGGTLTLSDLRRLDSSRVSATIGNLVIAANQSDSDANILANPRIRTRNREKAKILIGERVPNITSTATATGFVSESINYVDVGLKLDVEPTLYADSEVMIKVGLEVSNIINQVQTKAGSLAYQIGTRSAQTVLRLKDGENQILAGLISDEERNSANKVPLLGDVPLAGRLFGRHSDNNAKTEIVLSITPRIVRGAMLPPAELLDFDSGTEASMAVRSISTNPATRGAAPVPRTPDPASTQPAEPPQRLPTPDARATGGPSPTSDSLRPSSEPSSSYSPPAAVAPSPPRAFWHAAPFLKRGDEFVATLMLQTELPLTALDLNLGFDPKQVEILKISEGSLMNQGGAATAFDTRIEATGSARVSLQRTSPGGAVGLTPLLMLKLKALPTAQGPTSLALRPGRVLGLEGRAIAAGEWPTLQIRVQP